MSIGTRETAKNRVRAEMEVGSEQDFNSLYLNSETIELSYLKISLFNIQMPQSPVFMI